MAFGKVMLNMLKSNPALRREVFAAKKAAGGIGKGLTPTPQAKKIVAELEKKEAQVLRSKECKTAFEQTVKPEMRPYQAMEDCYNKGYLQTKKFWARYPLFDVDLNNKLRKVSSDKLFKNTSAVNDIKELFKTKLLMHVSKDPSVRDIFKQKISRPDVKYTQNPNDVISSYLTPRNSEYIREMQALRNIQGEIDGNIDRSKLKITLDSIKDFLA